MFKSFALFIGNRYNKAKHKEQFISFISLTSMLGIALGVMVLITVLSVMNGFNKEIRQKILSITPHITMKQHFGNLTNWEPILQNLLQKKEIIGATPYITTNGMLTNNGHMQPAILLGIDPNKLNDVYPLANSLINGKLQDLKPGKFGVVLGVNLAYSLGVNVGNKVTLLIPETTITPAGITPRFRTLQVVGIFKTNTEFDSHNIFLNLTDAAKLLRMQQGISGIQIKVDDETTTPKLVKQLGKQFPYPYHITDWTHNYSNWFDAINMEKTVMACILLLLIAIAAFNLISSLVMIVNDKRVDIAILQAMGSSRKQIMGIFIVQGCIIGIFGTILGAICGLILASNVTYLVNMLQQLLQIKFISEDVYLIGFLPSVIKSADVIMICCFAFLMSILATIYPAWKATKIQPAEALRYA